ncbi:MAG: response regulator [Anaerobacillus sp.]|uniref:GGDEF domain-containing response regulator n=1 Tax=Anaerobacillus sp. TaxID=1872506 RepID=UPI00391B1B86
MEKYQKLFLERMQNTLKQWEEKGVVSEANLFRFLHTIKGTAATIGLLDISIESEKKLKEISETGERTWSNEEWRLFLQFLVKHNGNQTEIKIEREEIEKVTDNDKLILLIDDDITMVNFLKGNFEKEGYMVLAAVTADKALKLFYDHKPDIILLDIHLQDHHGFKLFTTILEKSQSYFIPIILLSSEDNKETRIRGYKQGAVDFIAKPFSFDELMVRVENRIKYKDIVSNAVLIDELTGAFNRKFLKLELNRYLFELNRTKEVLSLVVIDLDHFKKVNDTYGHHIGDVVLKGFAQFVLSSKRTSDYLIRYGGEEFILLLPHTKKADAKLFVNRLLEDFSAVSFFSEDGAELNVTFSAGVVEIANPQTHIDEYVKRADIALYNAKEQGRSQVCLYEGKGLTVNSSKSNIHIAIIDDDVVVHELVKERLAKLSFGNIQVDFKSFREGELFFASDWHKQNGRFLILLDGIMPRMDGLEVLKKLRGDYPEKKFVVLMLTGRKSEKDVVRALELGADDYLTKPFSIAELEARVKRLVKRMMM